MQHRPRISSTLAIALAAVAPIQAQAAEGESMVKQTILGESTVDEADIYWPLEDSFWSLLQSGGDRVKILPQEIDGLTSGTPGSPGEPEYFPLFPDHMTQVSRSTAAIFGETHFDLASTGNQVDRYLSFDDIDPLSELGDEDLLAEFGMQHKGEWTVHMIVSPDEDSTRGWEMLFDIGDLDHENNSVLQPVRISIEANKGTLDTEFRATIQSEGSSVSSTVTVDDTDVKYLGANGSDEHGRYWYQVIAQYYKNTSNVGFIRLTVNSIDSSTGYVNTDDDVVQANMSRKAPDETVARIGRSIDDSTNAQQFHGAIHHFAAWKGLVDSSYSVTDKLDDLAEAFKHAHTGSNTKDQPEIDWAADPRYYIWDRPTTEDAPASGTRSLQNWNDAIWQRDYVYPIVRFLCDLPGTAGTNYRPPTLARGAGTDISPVLTSSLLTAEGIAQQAADWMRYLDAGLEYYDTTSNKRLSDDRGCVVLMQNWGKEHDDYPYLDRNASRAMMHNWRDTPSAWVPTDSGPGDVSSFGDDAEIHAPFYREGMSINAFRSTDMFKKLAELIAADNDSSPVYLHTPDRFHMDIEEGMNISRIWDGASGSVANGWWDVVDGSTSDDRTGALAYWAPPTGASGYQTIDDLAVGDSPSPSHSRYAKSNDSFSSAFSEFAQDQYDHALGTALILPARRELGSDIRFSEYNVFAAGSATNFEQSFRSKAGRPTEDAALTWLDFSSPILYPVKGSRMNNYSGGDDETLFQEWETELGISGLITPDISIPAEGRPNDNGSWGASIAEVEKDARLHYVELAKWHINSAYLSGGGYEGLPTAPWLPYPEHTGFKIEKCFDVHGTGGTYQGGDDDVDDDDIFTIPVVWQDVAKTAVFAYRHGVREFIFWGNNTSANNVDSVEGLELVMDAIEAVKARPLDFTTTGATSGDDDYGIPDGVYDEDDFIYFGAMLSAGDLIADIAGAGPGTYGSYPDGVVDSDDANYFSNNFYYD